MINSVFVCNICGSESIFNPIGDWREAESCNVCGSSVRIRQLAYCLTSCLFGTGKIISEVDAKNIRGIGLSDPDNLSDRLSIAFNYTNTYYHKDPRLDICNPSDKWIGINDFIVSSDVFEHVPSPVQNSFDGAFKTLRPGGLLVLTVPFDDRPFTTEHFDKVRDFRLVDFDGEWLLIGKTEENRYELHDQLVFHGGPGTTVEMRFFSQNAVIAHLREAGFSDVTVYDKPVPEFGIFPPHFEGLPITARAPMHSIHADPLLGVRGK